MAVRTGFDTGFFVLLATGRSDVLEIWQEILDEQRFGVVSALSLYELDRLGLRGTIDTSFVAKTLSTIPQVCEVVWLDELDPIRQAARLSQGHALSLADSLILASLLSAGCEEILTTDKDLVSYRSGQVEVRNLREFG